MIGATEQIKTPEILISELLKPGNLVHGVEGIWEEHTSYLLNNGLLPNMYLRRLLPDAVSQARYSYVPYGVSFSMLGNSTNALNAYREAHHRGPKCWQSEIGTYFDFGIITTPQQLLPQYADRIEARGRGFVTNPHRYNVQNDLAYGIPVRNPDEQLVSDEIVVNFSEDINDTPEGIKPQDWKGIIFYSRRTARILREQDNTKLLSHIPFLYFTVDDTLEIY